MSTMVSEELGNEGGGPGGTVGFHRPVVDGAPEFEGDGVGDHLRGGGGELHPAAGVVLAQAVADVEVLLEVVTKREIQERPPVRRQLHAGRQSPCTTARSHAARCRYSLWT